MARKLFYEIIDGGNTLNIYTIVEEDVRDFGVIEYNSVDYNKE